MSPDMHQSLRTDACLANPSGLQAARWMSPDTLPPFAFFKA
jgi:hypothetical protein